MEVSGSKSVANCGRSTYVFSMCFDGSLTFHGDVENPGMTRFESGHDLFADWFGAGRPGAGQTVGRAPSPINSPGVGCCLWMLDYGCEDRYDTFHGFGFEVTNDFALSWCARSTNRTR